VPTRAQLGDDRGGLWQHRQWQVRHSRRCAASIVFRARACVRDGAAVFMRAIAFAGDSVAVCVPLLRRTLRILAVAAPHVVGRSIVVRARSPMTGLPCGCRVFGRILRVPAIAAERVCDRVWCWHEVFHAVMRPTTLLPCARVRVVLAVTALRCAAVVFFGFCALSDTTIGGGDFNRASGLCVLRSPRSVLLTMAAPAASCACFGP
jgi:hypothetical protein